MQQATAPEIRIDWFQVINDLGRRGFPSQLIADFDRRREVDLARLEAGAEPKHGDGERLIAFWCRVMERQREALPLVSGGDWWAYHSTRAR